MKNKYLLLFAIGYSCYVTAQTPEIKAGLPTIMGPSPTVAALMKFEETPVSNYTGLPDISIPLYSTQTKSKDINLSIALKYHAAGTMANQVASDTGLGWSLFAGGTISRTVKGIADEYYQSGSADNKVGIYGTDYTANKNSYYDVQDFIHDDVSTLSSSEIAQLSEWLWEANEKGKYDSEHDLWQFDFMGHSGRFYIKKNMTTGMLEVVKLTADDALKIVNHYDTTTSDTRYTPISFDIYDSKGYKFVFDVVETTLVNTVSNSTYVNQNVGNNTTPTTVYRSAFHLSAVYDNNGNPIIELEYENGGSLEVTHDVTNTYNYMNNTDIGVILDMLDDEVCQSQAASFEPVILVTTQQRRTTTRKLKKIEVEGVAKIDFKFVKGRSDSNLTDADDAYVFKGITVKTWNNDSIRKVTLTHSLSTVIDSRMVLDAISFANFTNSLTEDYHFAYRRNEDSGKTISTDYWGYFNLIPNYHAGVARETSPEFCTTDVLQKMTLPTGGSIVYDFESNTYSHIGAEELTAFDENPDNWTPQTTSRTFTAMNVKQPLFTLTDEQIVTFVPSIFPTDWRFKIYKVVGGVDYEEFSVDSLSCTTPGCYVNILMPAGDYKINFSSMDLNFPNSFTADITAHHKTKNTTIKPFLYGGGVRIKKIGYFSTNVDAGYYQDNMLTPLPSKEKKFNYSFEGQWNNSSGSLVYPKPVYTYVQSKLPCVSCSGYVNEPLEYTISTSFNNLPAVQTQGSDVGYKNVKVYETDNGFSEFTYRSPIDFPNEITTEIPGPPFLSAPNYDCRRGQVVKEKVYDGSNRILSETIFSYDVDEYVEETGLRTRYRGMNCPKSGSFSNYAAYLYNLSLCRSNPLQQQCLCFCDIDAIDMIGYVSNYEVFGWSKLISKVSKEYFYEGSTERIVQTDETFNYNPANKQISEHTTTGSNGEILKTEYYYHTGNSDVSQNRISEIQQIKSYSGSTLLSNSKVIYDNPDGLNHPWRPRFIQTAKGVNSLEDKINFSKYDEFSNPELVMQSGGNLTYYVWGYNDTQPIAKIESHTTLTLPATLIGQIKGYSDDNNQAALFPALQSLRQQLPDAMITTYTYYPLIGIRTITDPKGMTTSYEYDAFGRLHLVRDNQGNVLSENEYHYQTQN